MSFPGLIFLICKMGMLDMPITKPLSALAFCLQMIIKDPSGTLSPREAKPSWTAGILVPSPLCTLLLQGGAVPISGHCCHAGNQACRWRVSRACTGVLAAPRIKVFEQGHLA